MTVETLVRRFDLPRAGLRTRWPDGASERIVAIGDIHGCWDLLNALIAAIDDHMHSLRRARCRLVILGDFIDRGPSSDRVIALLRNIGERFESATIVQGNHESSLLASARGDPDAQQQWLMHGGLETLRSFAIDPPRADEGPIGFGARIVDGIGVDTLDWIERLPQWVHLPPYFFCHAGIRPGQPLKRQREDDLLWIRKPFLDSKRDHGAIIVHGHSISPEVEIRHNRIGLDTGAYESGMLSAVILDPAGNWIVAVRSGGQVAP